MKRFQDLDLSLEDVLLLSCARSTLDNKTRGEIDFILDNDLDWDHILDMATRHRLLPLLYINLNAVSPSKVPVEVLRDLKGNFHDNARRNLLLTGELIKVIQLLEDEGVQAVTYKGPVLAYSAYGNVGYRQFGDIDLFIEKADVSKAKNIMTANGYCLDPPIEVDNATYMKLDSEYRFKTKSGVLIELNWNFEGPYFSFKSNPRKLFSDLIVTPINNFEIRTPSAENEFLMMCIHCAKHNWNRLLWIIDLAEVIENKDINWLRVNEIAEELGVKRIVSINLILVRDLRGSQIPDGIELNSDKKAVNIALQIKKRLFDRDKSSWNLIEKFFLDLKKRDSFQIGIKDCVYGLSKPSYDDYQDLKLPESSFRLYLFIRPFLLLRKYGKGEI